MRFLAALLLCLIASVAEARTHVEFDRHAISQSSYVERSAPKHVKKRHVRSKSARKAHVRTESHQRSSAHQVVASTGAKASVSTVARPHFTCLIGKLEAVGYRIDFMGGYASRGNSSAHPTGNALDINQTGRNIVTRRLPSNATELARDCGLVHGAVWSNPDQGHFEMPKKYGYVFHRHRTRYAAAR